MEGGEGGHFFALKTRSLDETPEPQPTALPRQPMVLGPSGQKPYSRNCPGHLALETKVAWCRRISFMTLLDSNLPSENGNFASNPPPLKWPRDARTQLKGEGPAKRDVKRRGQKAVGTGGGAGTGPFTPTPLPLPAGLAGKCRTMGAKGALRKFCLT